MPSEERSNLKAFSLEGRLYRERERLLGMTDEEREWRAQWVRDQKLCPNEPGSDEAIRKALRNPIKRFYQLPFDMFEKALRPVLGRTNASVARYCCSWTLMSIALLYAGAYYFKYNANDWTRKGGWRVLTSRPALLPNEEGFPSKYNRKLPSEYGGRGFRNSPI